MWKELAWPRHFTKRGYLGAIQLAYPLHVPLPSQDNLEVMYLCVRGVEFASFYDFDMLFWNCSDDVLYNLFVFHFVSAIFFLSYIVTTWLIGVNIPHKYNVLSLKLPEWCRCLATWNIHRLFVLLISINWCNKVRHENSSGN